MIGVAAVSSRRLGMPPEACQVRYDHRSWVTRRRIGREKRQLPPGLITAAAANPGGSVAEIDGSVARDPERLCAARGGHRRFPGRPRWPGYRRLLRNPRYGRVQDDFTKLEPPDHRPGWLPDTPGRSVRAALEESLVEQVAGTGAEWVKIAEEPAFLPGGVRSPSAPDHLTVRRAAVAVVFAPGVRAPGRRLEILTGAFSWAAVGLDRPGGRRDRTWLDLGMSREHAEELLRHRVYRLDEVQ